MRAVKTVITVAGNLIRQMPDGDERQIVLRSLRDVNVPKFLADDLLLFNGKEPSKFKTKSKQALQGVSVQKSEDLKCSKPLSRTVIIFTTLVRKN